ncbi:hypothetical protein PV325_001766 [Microctonus aethiopoides]|nr:hypothetical protein PV325_001766 [Microctonus aethiopoides]
MKLMPLMPTEPINNKDLPFQLIHECQLQSKADDMEIFIPGNEFGSRIKRWIIRQCILSRKHPFAKNCIKSTAGINNEIHRHITLYPYTIYPFSEFRNMWELFMTIFLFFTLLLIPFITAFHFEEPHKWYNLLLIFNIFYIADTVLQFFAGYFDETSAVIIMEKKLIIKKYLKTYFILDIISALPVYIIFIITCLYREPKWYWSFFNIIKIVRIRNFIVYFRNLKQRYQISFRVYKIMEMTIVLILCIHWAACLELYVPLIGAKIDWQNTNRSIWFYSEDINKIQSKIYILCMSRATISLSSSSHFRDMKTTEDIMLNIFLTILGRIGFIYILAQFLMIVATFHSTKKKIVRSLQQLQEYMQYKELPRSVQKRIITYYTYWSNKSYKRDKLIISNVSPSLRQELLMYTCATLFENVEFFKHLPHSILRQIVLLLKAEIFLTNDVLVKCGTMGDALYYIMSGTVAVYSDKDEKICHLEDGSYFGEVALVMENEKRLSTIIAMETCEVYVLKRSDFVLTIGDHSYLMTQLQKLTIEKSENSVFETIHKCEGSFSTEINIFGTEKPKE